MLPQVWVGPCVVTDGPCYTALLCGKAGVGMGQLFTGWSKNRFTVVNTPLASPLCFVGNTPGSLGKVILSNLPDDKMTPNVWVFSLPDATMDRIAYDAYPHPPLPRH